MEPVQEVVEETKVEEVKEENTSTQPVVGNILVPFCLLCRNCNRK